MLKLESVSVSRTCPPGVAGLAPVAGQLRPSRLDMTNKHSNILRTEYRNKVDWGINQRNTLFL